MSLDSPNSVQIFNSLILCVCCSGNESSDSSLFSGDSFREQKNLGVSGGGCNRNYAVITNIVRGGFDTENGGSESRDLGGGSIESALIVGIGVGLFAIESLDGFIGYRCSDTSSGSYNSDISTNSVSCGISPCVGVEDCESWGLDAEIKIVTLEV